MFGRSSLVEGPVQGLVPLNRQEIDELKCDLTRDCLPYFKAVWAQHQITEEADKKLVVLDRELDERAKRIDVLDERTKSRRSNRQL